MGLGTLCIDTVAISSGARPLRRAGQQPTTICGAAAINAPCCSTAAVSDKPSDASWLAIYRRSRRRGCSTRRRFQRKHSTQVFARVGRRGDATAQLQRSEANSPSTEKLYDVVAISNLCVDVVVPVEGSEQLPIGVSGSEKRALLERLTTKCCDRDAWEVGGNSNFLIAASRLGLRAASIGQVGNDGAGRFLRDVFEREGIQGVKGVVPDGHPLLSKTLLCFVLVAPNADHAFCSTYDLGPWPLLKGVDVLSPETREMLRRTRALFLNGYVLDELPGSLVMLMVKEAMSHGAAIFFDPGPRSHSLMMGENRAFLDEILDCADAVLMTEEEAEMVTGCAGAEAAAERMLGRQGSSGHWIVVKRGADGALLAVQGHRPVQLPGIKVQVQDTVGCGDSFAAAMVLGYIRGHPPLTALALANAVGAATATGRGAGRNVASAEQVRALLLSQSAAPAAAASDSGSSTASHAALELLEQSLAAAPRTLV